MDSRANGYPEGYEQREGAMRGLEDLQNGGVSIENGELDGGELGGEDVFLNLARSNSVSGYTENSAYRAERRRVGYFFFFNFYRDSLGYLFSLFFFLSLSLSLVLVGMEIDFLVPLASSHA